MKVLVTGGAGFIGSNTVIALVNRGDEVVVLDDLFLGKKENLADVLDKIKFVQGNITDAKLVEDLAKVCDGIIHFASASSAPMYEPDPRQATYVTVNGFLNVLEAARKNNVKKVVYASSSSVYGNNKPPHNENQQVVPISFYTAAKLAKEMYAAVYSSSYGIKIAAMRYFSVYGPREMHKGRFANVISQFLWTMQKGQSPIIYGDGSQSRDYVYVKDVVMANLLALDKGANGVFNVGTGKAASFNDIVAMLNKLLSTAIKPKYVSNPLSNYVAHTLADTKKTEKELGFKAKYSIQDGLKEILAFESKSSSKQASK